MKSVYAKDVANKVGDVVKEKFLVTKAILNVAKDGKEWVSCLLNDVTGKVHGKIWAENMAPGRDYSALVGKICEVEAYVDMYDGEASFVIRNISECKEYENLDFCAGLTEEQQTEYLKKIKGYINMISDDSIKSLVSGIFDCFGNMFLSLPAGRSIHHAFNGALMVHTLEVTDIAYAMYCVDTDYSKPYTIPLDRDLVIAGALLHDVGKIAEYKSFPSTERTLRGCLIGHLTEGIKCINAMNNRLGNDRVCQEKMNFLEHIILSSHGGEGGGCKPMIKEAVIVKNADMMSAEADAFDTCFKEWDEKHIGNDDLRVWSKTMDTYVIRRRN